MARFAGAPLAALARALGPHRPAQEPTSAGAARPRFSPDACGATGETIRAVLLYADLRGSAACRGDGTEAVIGALDAWFDRIAGAVHAFGGEILKFIGDGVLAIFPIGGRPPSEACDAALQAVIATRAGMAHLDEARAFAGACRGYLGIALHLGDMLLGNIGTANHLDFTAIAAMEFVDHLEGVLQAPRPQRAPLRRRGDGNRSRAGPARRACPARHRRALQPSSPCRRRERPDN